ncbi:hypothetical protein ZWY2020_039928 [Hordeum vulgare]|nr:hypothetical protein ZWY2020_039928 [Hordeum vulgare]
MAHAGGSSFGCGGASESNWPQSLEKPLTEELHAYGLIVPPGCCLAKPWRICKDGYPTLDDPATPEQLRIHPGIRHNIRTRHTYWDGKSYYDVNNRHRQAAATAGNAGGIQRRRRAAIPHPPSAFPTMAPAVAPTEYEVPSEQFVLRKDGDPGDSPGLLVVMRASVRAYISICGFASQAMAVAAVATAREELEIAAAIQAASALAANLAPVGDDDDEVDSDGLANSSDDEDGAVDGPAVVYVDSD